MGEEIIKPIEEASKAAHLADESKLLGVSIRGWLTAIIIITVCVLSFINKDMLETLKNLALLVAGVYWGQKK